jgi:hypothetical protein
MKEIISSRFTLSSLLNLDNPVNPVYFFPSEDFIRQLSIFDGLDIVRSEV